MATKNTKNAKKRRPNGTGSCLGASDIFVFLVFFVANHSESGPFSPSALRPFSLS